jgi:hypothetical protein
MLDRLPGECVSIIYLDAEQMLGDVMDRLDRMGFSADDDFSAFHYYLLPDLPPLTTARGGEEVMALVRVHKAQLVIVDTLIRVLGGNENDADILADYHRHTGELLKKEGVTVLRLDHAGKDPARGQRGTSGKNDDVDIVLELSRREGGAVLTATKSRTLWMPQKVELIRRVDPIRYERRLARGWLAGTIEAAALLDRLGVPIQAGRSKAREALRDAGESMDTNLLADAIRWRKRPTPIHVDLPE